MLPYASGTHFSNNSMVIYEITAVVEGDLALRYEEYMIEKHIPDILATGYFFSAALARSGDRYKVRFEANHISKIDQYIELRAPLLRADFQKHFPTGVLLSREILDVLAQFPANK